MTRRRLATPCALLAALALAPAVRADDDAREPELDRSPDLAGTVTLPLPVPERPFLLLDAPRRFAPDEDAEVRVQLGENGRVSLAIFAVADPTALLASPPPRQGVAIARTPLGAEAERLVAQGGAVPRAGRGLTLVRALDAALRVNHRSRTVGDETVVYDSNETGEDDIATVWVNVGGWSVQDVSLGRLPAGLYLVRAHAGSWAATTMLSVGTLTVLARRGDAEDRVMVTDGEGTPQPGVAVESWAGSRRVATGQTDAHGEARLTGDADPRLRFVARRGDDVTWADVGHVRLDACDPRVYLAIGRPYYRPGETIHLRGHVRGCAAGDDAPLADEPVTLWPVRAATEPQTERVTVRSDAEGNFIATLVADRAGLGALVRGRSHERPVPLDTRPLPQRALTVRLDRSWAAAGEWVEVQVEDEDGGWPSVREVVLDGPGGRQRASIGPRDPASFRVRIPPTEQALERLTFTATLEADRRVTSAQAALWTGQSAEVVELDAPRTWATAGESLEVGLRAADLGGAPRAGAATLRLRPSDGNRATGGALWTGRATLGADGLARVRVPLSGTGPWLLEVDKGGARGELVVWDRPRPPQLSRRGPLAVQPRVSVTRPDEPLSVDVRLPPGEGRGWVTLEQGGVWASALVGPGTSTVALPVPRQARGMAAIVVTAVHKGQLTTASSTVEVETSRAVELSVRTDKRIYAPAARAKVTIEARATDGTPRPGVASLWLADAGYWELGPEEYPTPTELFRLPGRRAGAGDGTRPVSYGAEEGRVVDARLEWNGRALDHATFRHGWGFGGELVRVQARGTLDDVLTAFARRVGFLRAEVCRELPRPREASLLVQDVPWDLAALRLADELGASVRGERRVLRFDCGGVGLGGLGTHGRGSGSGYGSGAGGLGLGRIREQSLEGTLHFIGSIRLGADGRASVEIPLPDHPGRWRVEVTAIAADGGGASAGAVVHTSTPLEAAFETAAHLVPGDVTVALARVIAPSLVGQTVALSLELPPGLVAETALPATASIPRGGRLELPVRLRAERAGTLPVLLRARAGAAEDAVRRTLEVGAGAAHRPLALRAPVGPDATEVRVQVPALAQPARVRIAVDDGIAASLGNALAAVRAPRWRATIVHVDRLATLRALQQAARSLPDTTARAAMLTELERSLAGESERLAQLRAADGTWSIWSHLPTSQVLTAETLYHLGPTARGTGWRRTWDALRAHATAAEATMTPWPAAVIAAALATGGGDEGAAVARRLLPRALARPAEPADLETDTWAFLAARALGESGAAETLGARLAAGIDRALGREPAFRCAGPRWWLCFARWGEPATVARAARTLVEARQTGALALGARAARWAARFPAERGLTSWGTDGAEALALVAQLAAGRRGGASGGRFTVELDGRPVTWADAPAERTIEVPSGATLVVRLPAAQARAGVVRVDADLSLAPPAQPTGPAALTRAFLNDGGRPEVEVAFELAQATDRVEVVVPLPAGLSLSLGSGSSSREPTSLWEEWSFRLDQLRGVAADTAPAVEELDGALHLRFRHLGPGRQRHRVPLVAIAPGRYAAGPAWLRTADPGTWGVTPGAEVAVAGR